MQYTIYLVTLLADPNLEGSRSGQEIFRQTSGILFHFTVRIKMDSLIGNKRMYLGHHWY